MVREVDESIPHGGFIVLFLVPASAARLVYQIPWHVLSCLRDGVFSIYVIYILICSSVVSVFAHGAMGRRIDPSWGGPIELFLVPARAPLRPWYVLSCLMDGAYKRTLAVNRKE